MGATYLNLRGAQFLYTRTEKNMKTILIPIHDGTITKNLLRTDFLKLLAQDNNVKIVLLLNHADEDAYEKEFGIPGKVIIERAKVYNTKDKVELIFGGLFKHSIPTTFMKIRQIDWYKNEGKYLLYYSSSLLRLLGRFTVWKKFLFLVNYLEPIDLKVKTIYQKWQPDVIFAPTMVSRVEVALMRLGRRDKKVVIGMTKSFDNLTSKAFLRVYPDVLIVPNETNKKEAVELYNFPIERVAVTGICQYDRYVTSDILELKSSFFTNLGLNPSKKTILYAPAGDWMNATDHEVLTEILKWTVDGTLPNTQVLLRLHPTYESQTEKLEGHPNLVIERPGKHFGDLKWYEFEEADVRHLASSLSYADVVINTGSTLMIEAAIFDTPVIALGFDGYTKKDYEHSVVRYYDREHLVPVMHTGGVRLVTSFDSLRSTILEYFDNPHIDSEGRKKVVEKVCYKMDGKSCLRTAEVVLQSIRSTASDSD